MFKVPCHRLGAITDWKGRKDKASWAQQTPTSCMHCVKLPHAPAAHAPATRIPWQDGLFPESWAPVRHVVRATKKVTDMHNLGSNFWSLPHLPACWHCMWVLSGSRLLAFSQSKTQVLRKYCLFEWASSRCSVPLQEVLTWAARPGWFWQTVTFWTPHSPPTSFTNFIWPPFSWPDPGLLKWLVNSH